MVPSRTLRSYLFVFLVALLPGCGGGGGGFGPDLGGSIDTIDFSIPAGTTQRVTSNLVVRASRSIDIAGTMVVEPGVSVALLSDQTLTISGAIQSPSESKAAGASRGRDGGDDSFILEATTTTIPGKIEVDKKVLGCGIGENATLVVSGTIRLEHGADGESRTDPGDDGPSIEIGTPRAADALRALGKECMTLTTIDLRAESFVFAGTGGKGFQDGAGIFSGNSVDFVSTDGGNGGDILLTATSIVTNGFLRAGNGGDGGGLLEVAAHAKEGTAAGEKGGSETITTGNGGVGGDLFLNGSVSGVMGENSGPGFGGNAGAAFTEPGSGGPGGDGGDATVQFGSPGGKGTGPGKQPEDGSPPLFYIRGGNGGDSEDPSMPGGKGGTCTFTEKSSRELKLMDGSQIDDSLHGGFGFNGCGVAPQVKGTRGGNAGQVIGPAPLLARFSPLRGGDGGDGLGQAGAGGTGGTINNEKVGADGTAGELCAVGPPTGTQSGYLAISLADSYTLTVPNGSDFGVLQAGDVIPLCRIRHGRLAAPEPITEDSGCTDTHLHPKAGSGGIRIRTLVVDGTKKKWRVSANLADKQPRKCGYGKIIVVPSCALNVKQANLK